MILSQQEKDKSAAKLFSLLTQNICCHVNQWQKKIVKGSTRVSPWKSNLQ